MKKLLCYAALLLLVSPHVFAQDGETDTGGAKDEAAKYGRLDDLKGEAALLLQSPSNRERAWGAYLVGQHGLKEQTPALLEILADQSPGDSRGARIVRQAALDSLIRLEVKVPADALKTLPPDTTDEKIILMSRAPDESSAALLEMFDKGSDADRRADARWLAVGNLLAETKAQGFAALLLKWLKVEADITVLDRASDMGYGYGYGGGCGGGVDVVTNDFPPVGFYELVADAPRGAVVVAPGKYPVSYLRTVRFYGGGCYHASAPYVRDFYRVEYLAGLLDTTAGDLKLDARPSRTIVCKDARQCLGELTLARREIMESYDGTVTRLVEKNLIEGAQAAAMTPDVTFILYDKRQNKTFPLPERLRGVKIVIEGKEDSPADSSGSQVEAAPAH